MKIAIDISQIVYGTGVSRYSENLVKALLQVDNKNQYILLASSLRSYGKLAAFKEELENYPNVEFKFSKLPPSILEFLWNRLHTYPIEKMVGPVDIFHSSDWLEPPVMSKATKKVTTVHDMISYLFPSSMHPKIISNQKRRMALVKKESDAIIADSKTTKDDVVKFLEIPEEKVKVIPLAASEDFKPQNDEFVENTMAKYKLKKPYILSVATQEPRKNLQKLLDAFEQVLKVKPDANLVLVGKYGWGGGLHTPGNVIWTNYVPEEDLVNLYSGCQVFVYPSLYEGFGLPILEAMACGAPVITSNNSSMEEVGKNAAILVDPRNEKQIAKAIEFVLNLNGENYEKMKHASISRAKEYSWEKTAKDTLKLYEDLVKESETQDDLVYDHQNNRYNPDEQEEISPDNSSIE